MMQFGDDTQTHDLARENETLRAEVERLQGHMRALADTSVDRDTAGIFKGMWQGSERECEQLRAEIERLNGVVDSWVDINNAAGVTLRAQEAEIERLQHENMRLQTANDYAFDPRDGELSKLNREVDRLRAAVVLIASGGTKYDSAADLIRIARAALDTKP